MILGDTVCGTKGKLCCVLTGAAWHLGAEKKTGVGFTPEDEKPPLAKAGDKEIKPEPGCAGNIVTGNDSGCAMAKLPLVMFELMVCKGTADGGSNTCALECIFLTGKGTEAGNETSLQWQKACAAKLRHSPMSMTMDSRVTQCCVLMFMTLTGVNCMSEDSGSRRS